MLRRRAAAGGRAFLVLGLAAASAAACAQAVSPGDSLRLALLRTELAQAEAECTATDLWHRLIPQITLSAALSSRNALFVDPATLTAVAYPRDSYRLSATLSLSELFVPSRHEAACLRVTHLRQEYALAALEIGERADARMWARQSKALWLREELHLREELAGFDSLRFQEGRIGFQQLVESRIALMAVRRALHELEERPDSVR